MINFLDTSNYAFSDEEETTYLTCGLRSLYRISKKYNIPFREMCLHLHEEQLYVFGDFEIKII